VDATSVYWTGLAVPAEGIVMKVPLNGGTATVLASAQAKPYTIAVDAASVYWANYNDGTIMKVPIGGGAIVKLVSGQPVAPGSTGIAVDATSVYWTTGSGGSVMKVPLAGGVPTTLASGQATPDGIAVDATSVYWVNSGVLDPIKGLDPSSGSVMELSLK
jgi:sugar lactone lactonase YvrE